MADIATPATKVTQSPIKEFTGFSGGVFACYAREDAEFGDPRVKYDDEGAPLAPASIFRINDREVKITSWKGSAIKGEIPRDLKKGPCKITVDSTTFDGKIS